MFELREDGGVLRVSGDLEVGTSDALYDRLSDYRRQGLDVSLDLGGVGNIDTAALQVILAYCRQGNRDRFRPLLGASGSVRRAARMLGLDSMLGLDEAI